LATADKSGRPSARMVLLKGLDEHGFVFYTNYDSRKGHELTENPQAALTFWWEVLERQVRIEGRVEQVAPEISEAYFDSRPEGSRFGAVVSPQSQLISSRQQLEQDLDRLIQDHQRDSRQPKRPDNWGGYRVLPSHFEFWQGRPRRLHDRIVYQLQTDGSWQITRLAP